jgi:2-polyprenyl-3-methyl-5-hydroxy-6-metoxy-1,4-benzoquinol methylase
MTKDRLEEIKAELAEVQKRVQARYDSAAPTLDLPDLLPILHARDRAQGKVGAIGTVNPRPSGLLNQLIQSGKRQMARALNFLLRPQVEFNQTLVDAIQANLEILNDTNRALKQLSGQIHELRTKDLQDQAARVETVRDELKRSFREWEVRQGDTLAGLRDFDAQRSALLRSELLREILTLQTANVTARDQISSLQNSIADTLQQQNDSLAINQQRALEALALQHRDVLEANRRDSLQANDAYRLQLAEATANLQASFWAELAKVRREYEQVIHSELRLVRQRLAHPPIVSESITASANNANHEIAEFDYGRFSERFRGADSYVRAQQQQYVTFFKGKQNVLDVGFGRGEFLELLREVGVPARGIEGSAALVAQAKAKGLDVEQADLFAHLDQMGDASVDGIFCSQVIEHLPIETLPLLVNQMAKKLRSGGVLLVETPNPECLAIFASHFFLDPTHQRPIPPALASFLFEEAGLVGIQIIRNAAAADSMPAVHDLPRSVQDAFFGSLDYACVGIKP